MGHELSEKKKRDYLISIIQRYLETSKALMQYYHAVADTRKAKLVCTRSIKGIDQAITHLRQIKHIEILDYLYASFIGNNAIAYSISGKLVLAPKLLEYDTDDGVVELRQLMEENKQKELEKEKKRQETINAVNKAKAEGKKVEMVWDNDTKTAKPVIVSEKPNA